MGAMAKEKTRKKEEEKMERCLNDFESLCWSLFSLLVFLRFLIVVLGV